MVGSADGVNSTDPLSKTVAVNESVAVVVRESICLEGLTAQLSVAEFSSLADDERGALWEDVLVFF